jgi:hypothetical protein
VTLLEAAIAVTDRGETWLGMPDADSLYILLASLLLAFIAFVILMRVRF